MTTASTNRTWWTPPRKAVVGWLFTAAMSAVAALANLAADNGVLAGSFAVLAVVFLGLADMLYALT